MRFVVIIGLVILVLVGGVLAYRAQAGPSGTLYVAVPMGIYVPFNKVVTAYQQQYPRVKFRTMINTPEAMVEACEVNPEKPDIFISPGGREASVLAEKGLLDPDTMVAFGSYKVVILVPKGNPGGVTTPEDLLNPAVETISFSPPDLNAASHAARLSLKNLGIWDKIQDKVEVTGCCNESFQWVVDGRAEANVQFLGCPMDTSSQDLSQVQAEIACILPTETHYVPRNVAGILTTTRRRELAENFLAFMSSPEVIEMMSQSKLRNDQELPLTAGPWGPAQEANPMEVAGK